ncbi:MAG TPA: cell wall hydrolase [Novosphingobium sp.]|nr:cell wall hydrolase [Novosphingobium sp.]
MATYQTALHEPRPRDFTARLKRSRQREMLVGARRKAQGKQALALLGAVALPAFAAPADWDRFQIGNAGEARAEVRPMPFEQAGGSFPGSAFYYLDLEVPKARMGEGIHSDADNPLPADKAPSASAQFASPFRIDNSGIDRTRALDCLTAAVYYEAASEADSGQRAVAQVVLNRVAHSAYPDTVCGVVYQGSQRRTGCQFTFTCDGSLARRPNRMFWLRAENVARDALAGYVYTPIGLATHYHTVAVNPYWAPSLHYLGTIGAHRFYSFQGAAGRRGAFRFAYLGGEPSVTGRMTAPEARTPEAALDPVQLQLAYDEGLRRAEAASLLTAGAQSSAAAPVYSQEVQSHGGEALYRGSKLPETTGVKPEFLNSGRWITQPTD